MPNHKSQKTNKKQIPNIKYIKKIYLVFSIIEDNIFFNSILQKA